MRSGPDSLVPWYHKFILQLKLQFLSIGYISFPFKPSLVSRIPVISSYYIWHRNCLLSQEKMSPLEENLFMKLVDDTEGQGELAEEDKDFLESLEKMAQEVEDEADSID